MEKIDIFAHNWLAAYLNNRAFKQNLDTIKGKVVDLGCGTSPYREDILAVASSYIGVDWEHSPHDSEQVDVVADLGEVFPFEDGSVDTVVALQVLEHLREPGFFLSECHRILAEGGAVFLTVPFVWHMHEQPYDYQRFTSHGLQYMLSNAGFKEVEVGKYCGFWPACTLQFNYHSLKYARRNLKPLWRLLWLADQLTALVLDRLDSDPLVTTHFWASGKR